MEMILKDGTYAIGDFIPADATEVPPRPRYEAVWENNKWTFPAELVMSDLRKERDMRLSEVDWWASTDLTMTADQTAYRKSLRDLPSTASPELDENGELTNVTWPTKPE